MPPKESKTSKSERELLDEEQQLNDEIVKMSLRLSALKAQHSSRLEEIASLKRDRDGLWSSCGKCEDDLNTATMNRVDVLTDFARQYKSEESIKVLACIRLDTALNLLEEEKLRLADELKSTEVEYEEAISTMKKEYDSLVARISEMEKEFADIVGDTNSKVTNGQLTPSELC
ncbi:uncharacterized protein TM35_000153120 [Trypanosoma theileri]|uniref:Dynein regulatory complex protein 12 n=1 Tax=Trypanosoma theileri TaxID=67003 RepID=A0A1X0NW82_9TRYP|nr:uncharacterized protein TM35_000153120 [Trypanosoma theileri]ORC88881.1 hypothetical protein TM35_000153120 [Trypanosoma theileri]